MPHFPPPLHQLKFSKAISEDDWMYNGESSYAYFMRGYDALSIINLAEKRGQINAKKILDFGCGHGCVARMLKAHYPGAQIYGQDVNPDWLAWCRENLAIETIQSAPLIADVQIEPNTYDLIWVGSVFTHIPERNFEHLLSQLVRGLRSDGMLIFTTAGRKVWLSFTPGKEKLISREGAEEALADYETSGYGFTPYVNGTYADWGRTLCTLEKVLDKIAQTPARLVFFQEGGWGNRQDVFAVLREDK